MPGVLDSYKEEAARVSQTRELVEEVKLQLEDRPGFCQPVSTP